MGEAAKNPKGTLVHAYCINNCSQTKSICAGNTMSSNISCRAEYMETQVRFFYIPLKIINDNFVLYFKDSI